MSDVKQELINYRLKRADDEFQITQIAVEKEWWNTVASRLYYSCYYLTIALFAKYDIRTSTHEGVKKYWDYNLSFREF